MKGKILIWMLALLLLCSFASALTLNDSLLVYHTEDDVDLSGIIMSDKLGNHDGTLEGGVTTGGSGRINQSFYGDGVDDRVDMGAFGFTSGNFSIQVWLKCTNTGLYSRIISQFNGAGTGQFVLGFNNGNDKLRMLGSTALNYNAPSTLCNDAWRHIVFTYDGTGHYYIDGVSVLNGTYARYGLSDINVSYFNDMAKTGTGPVNGSIDEVALWTRALSPAEVLNLSTGNQYPFTGGGTPAGGNVTNVDFTIDDSWTGNAINTFAINVSWSNGTTTQHSTTTGVVNLTDITPGNINATYWNMTGYFNKSITDTLTANTSNSINTDTYQAYFCLNASSKVNEAYITADNFTIDSTVSSSCFEISADTHNVMAQRNGWYSQNQSFTVTALSNTTVTVVNMSYTNLTIYAIDGTTNESLSNYDILIGSIANPFFIDSVTGVTNHSFYLINDTFNVSINMPGYATTTATANISVAGHTNYTFVLYRSNSVTITIRDEITNHLITDNVTVRWTNNVTTWENMTNTGRLFVHNISAGNYTLLFYSSNYSTRTYTISVGNLTTQFLTAYMISSAYSTIFTVKDQDTGDVMADVSFTMSKLVNSTWVTVESKYSDITGKVQVYYDPIGNYRFFLAKSDYEDLIFYLNPILFSTYDVFMVKSDLLNYSVDYDDLSITYSPQSFANNQNTTFNFLIASPDGLLTDYGITLTYPGGTSSASGVNAIGEQLSVWVNVTGATRWDRVKLDYNYTTTISGTRTFTQYLSIRTNATASENTWTANKDRTYGLGLFERVLIVTVIVIFTVGIATMVGNPIPGFAIGLFLFGFMVKLGFIPIWSILPSMFIGFLFLVWKSGGY